MTSPEVDRVWQFQRDLFYSFIQHAKHTIACPWTLLPLLVVLGLLSAYMSHPVTGEPFATGLNQPRGMAFDANGNLFVADAGALDTQPASGLPIITNWSGRVVRITPNREVTTVADRLPFTHDNATGIDVGPTDVAVLSGTLYVLTGEGYDSLSRSVLRVPLGGPPQPVANLLNFAMAKSLLGHMIGTNAVPANPYAMVAATNGSAFYVSDGASGRVMRVTLDGSMSLFAEVPKMSPLTGLVFGPDGKLYFADFTTQPHTPGGGKIWVADLSGKLAVAVTGLTMPIDVGFDATGMMYVLEFSDGRQPKQPYAPGVGRLLRIEPDGRRTVVLEGLNYPTAMVFSQVGDLYIAVNGAFTAPRQGAILKVPCSVLGPAQSCPGVSKSAS